MTTDTTKKGFDLSRDSVYVAHPDELRIIGGNVLPEGQRGPLDTDHKLGEHDLYDERLTAVDVTDAEVANIDAYGVIEPIVIAKDPTDGEPIVVDGRGRVRRARLANARRAARGEPPVKIKCVVIRSTGTRLMGAMIALNEVRNDDGPLVKLEKAKRLLERGVSEEDAAVTFGLDLGYFRMLLAYDDAAVTEVKSAVTAGDLSPTAAVELVKAAKTPDAQRTALAKAKAGAKGKPVTARAAIAAAKGATGDTSADMIPTRRELGKVLKAVAEYLDGSEACNDTVALLASEKAKVDPDRSHVVDGFYLGVQAALQLAFGKCKDADLLAMLAAAREGKS